MKSIKVSIAGRSYPLKVTEDEEPMVLEVAEQINNRLDKLQATYRNQEKQDYLAMTLLTYALESAKTHTDNSALEKVEAKTDNLIASLEKVLG